MQELVEKTEFKNRSGGHLGVVVLDREGKPVGANVEPDGAVFLSDDEMRLTAQAPRSNENNPFVPKKHEIRDPRTGDVVEEGVWAALEKVAERRPVPIGQGREERFIPSTSAEETGAPSAPQGPPPEGKFQPGEEVGDPTAQPGGA